MEGVGQDRWLLVSPGTAAGGRVLSLQRDQHRAGNQKHQVDQRAKEMCFLLQLGQPALRGQANSQRVKP